VSETSDWKERALALHKRGASARQIARATGVAEFRVEHFLGVGSARMRQAETMRLLKSAPSAALEQPSLEERRGALAAAKDFAAGRISRDELVRRISIGEAL
jgi:hypothetical protein